MTQEIDELIIYWKDRLARYRTPALHWQTRQTIQYLEELKAYKEFGIEGLYILNGKQEPESS